jgi:hypothetical protein
MTKTPNPAVPDAPLLSRRTGQPADIVPDGTTIRITRHDVPAGPGACAAQDIVEAVDAQGRVVARTGSGRPRGRLDGVPMPCDPEQEAMYQAGIRAGRRIAEAATGRPIDELRWSVAEMAESMAQGRRKSQPHWSLNGDCY